MEVRLARGLTCILVSHDLAVVTHMCDRLAVMNLGKVVDTLTVDDLAAGRIRDEYTQELVRGSQGYDPAQIRAV